MADENFRRSQFKTQITVSIVPVSSLTVPAPMRKGLILLTSASETLLIEHTEIPLSALRTAALRNRNADPLEWRDVSRNHEELLHAGGRNCDWDQS